MYFLWRCYPSKRSFFSYFLGKGIHVPNGIWLTRTHAPSILFTQGQHFLKIAKKKKVSRIKFTLSFSIPFCRFPWPVQLKWYLPDRYQSMRFNFLILPSVYFRFEICPSFLFFIGWLALRKRQCALYFVFHSMLEYRLNKVFRWRKGSSVRPLYFES